jgi:hypothetical protein
MIIPKRIYDKVCRALKLAISATRRVTVQPTVATVTTPQPPAPAGVKRKELHLAPHAAPQKSRFSHPPYLLKRSVTPAPLRKSRVTDESTEILLKSAIRATREAASLERLLPHRKSDIETEVDRLNKEDACLRADALPPEQPGRTADGSINYRCLDGVGQVIYRLGMDPSDQTLRTLSYDQLLAEAERRQKESVDNYARKSGLMPMRDWRLQTNADGERPPIGAEIWHSRSNRNRR